MATEVLPAQAAPLSEPIDNSNEPTSDQLIHNGDGHEDAGNGVEDEATSAGQVSNTRLQ